MSPARIVAIILWGVLLSLRAAASDYPPAGPGSNPSAFSAPIVLPNSLAYRITFWRGVNRQPEAVSRFQLQPGDRPLSVAIPGTTRARRFPFPRVRRVPPRDTVCYSVRSYRHERESRDSDVTVPVGYTTCTPRSKFQVKSADMLQPQR